ncbi:universal stress protein [Pedobacter arcticus]|uniref:universal stress protein n=1 Tax=Pedobacter arcticus TaxID=752140 RepID=UPI0002F95500|nr:universal stress protein [Pedobacter arcticus]
MKTIAVLTDFSKTAENATIYALHLAEHLQANIKLYHSFSTPSINPLGIQMVWPRENGVDWKADNMRQLEQLVDELKKEVSTTTATHFKLKIAYECYDADFATFLKMLELDQSNTVMLVLGSHEKSGLSWLTGNHVNEVMDHATLPLLVISENQRFVKINKIAFATDLSTTDIAQIHSLTSLASAFKAIILLTHIADESTDESKLQLKVDSLLKQVTAKANYANVYYRGVKKDDIIDGLNWMIENGQIEMLVLVHRHKSFFKDLFNSSISKKMAVTNDVPLLIYPAQNSCLPVF